MQLKRAIGRFSISSPTVFERYPITAAGSYFVASGGGRESCRGTRRALMMRCEMLRLMALLETFHLLERNNGMQLSTQTACPLLISMSSRLMICDKLGT